MQILRAKQLLVAIESKFIPGVLHLSPIGLLKVDQQVHLSKAMLVQLQAVEGYRLRRDQAFVAIQSDPLPAQQAAQLTIQQLILHLGVRNRKLLKPKFIALLFTNQLPTVRQAVQQASELLLERETTVNTKSPALITAEAGDRPTRWMDGWAPSLAPRSVQATDRTRYPAPPARQDSADRRRQDSKGHDDKRQRGSR